MRPGAVLLLACLAAAPACRGGAAAAPLRLARERLPLAPVSVAGQAGWFLLDTGAEGTLVAPALGARLEPAGGAHQVHGFGGDGAPREAARARSGAIRFGGSRLRYPEEVTVLDLGFLAAWAGQPVDGVLGWDVLREYVTGFDVRGARLVASRDVTAAEALRALGTPGAAATLPLDLRGDRPHVAARAGGEPLRLLLDTGAQRTSLSTATAARLGLQPAKDAPELVMRGVGGDAVGRLARLADLRLGDLAWTELDVLVTERPGPEDADGVLGMDVLAECVVVIDGRGREVHVARRER